MPVIFNSDYKPPLILRNGHINTILPAIFRKVKGIEYKRKRINTNDSDFIDIDISSKGYERTAIILHGLEGNANKPYMKAMAKTCNEAGYDAIAMNLRGCSGDQNLLLSSYHSGKTDDLEFIIQYICKYMKYKQIILIGFSLGGNIVLKYLGEMDKYKPEIIKAGIAISVPCDLKSSAIQLSKFSNKLYLIRFLRSLKKKAIFKIEKFKVTTVNIEQIKSAGNFYDFDNLFTAWVHGFKNAEDYWEKCSSLKFLSAIRIPTYLFFAKDDPFLPFECYPLKEADNNDYLHLELTEYGGHVGFMTHTRFKKPNWHETRVKKLLSEELNALS
ncbi:MAG: alpha/beta fold hydrolase [Bacteroidales bacterium]